MNLITCKVCGRKFETVRALSIHIKKGHKISSEEYYLDFLNGKKGTCLYCGKETKFDSIKNGYKRFCSIQCVNLSPETRKKIKETTLERYGVEHALQSKEIKEKKKQTNLKRYGVENPSQLKEVKEKSKQTMLKRHGVENPSQSKKIREKKKQTCLKNHGVDFPTQSKEIKEKIKQTMLKRHDVGNPSQSKKIRVKVKQTNLERYGEENYLQTNDFKIKSKQTCLKKYGVTNVNQLEEIKEKKKQTFLERYGVDNISKSDYFKKKLRQTNLERYGVISNLQLESTKQQIKKTCLNKYGVNHPSKYKPIRDRITQNHLKNFFNILINSDRLKKKYIPLFNKEDYQGVKGYKYQWKCIKCNTEFEDHLDNGRIPRCPTCYPLTGSSIWEKEVSEFCKTIVNNIVENDRTILRPKELDIYIPSKNLAIECDGNYWHSELYGKDKHYHLNKTKLCKDQGIQLLHIFEDEWFNKQDIVESIIKSKLRLYKQRIYARKTEFKEVNSDDAMKFLFDNHLQGIIHGLNYGLYYENELVSMITMGKPRYNNKYDYELLRFCNKQQYQIIGGLSKLIKNFTRIYPGNIISYCDRRYSNGKGYISSGFKLIHESTPNYFYTKGIERESRMKFQKHKLKDKLKTFDPNLTEWQNMQLNGYDRIWDCGNFVFEWNKKD